MIKIETLLNKKEVFSFSSEVVCIGFFDGVHKMHKKILEKTKNIAKENNFKWSIITFTEKVSDFLNSTKNNIQLKEKKYNIFEKEFNPNGLIEIQVNNETIKKQPEEFCDFLKNNLKVKKIVVGSDFKFGFKGEGNVLLLQKYFGKENIIIFDRVENISTSLIREKISTGSVQEIKKILEHDLIVSAKRTDVSRYLIEDFKIKLPNSFYLIRLKDQILEVEITDNSFKIDSNSDVIELELLEKK
ncbi:hypothetical protein [Spiroplasma sp. BIUS-1]|uniref:hypothetical protein n=1 Tax=Spiroplasma sp. BIUS-1 TaxID=216964 RepID=UPI0013993585|nr:hypothetical protein [Spiroplasma sp. BIUS-1]QHX36588.1 riboflavin kinase/FAD synthetase [Spiroplasma sp. BIUS-1]